MKKKILLAAAVFSVFGFQYATVQAQDNPVVVEVGGRQIRQQEFMKDFMQSVGDNLVAKGASEAEKRAALDEYVELYANFQAKLRDAHVQGLDTTAALRDELGKYRAELAAPYLIDSAMLTRILREAYDRNQYAVHAMHILVKVGPDADPEDTLAAYNRALELRKRVLDGENFHDVAIEEARRVDPQAKVQPNEGDLGYFTAFDMVYPFENAAYSLEPGELSMPVRTRFGYHIIKVIEKVKHYGKVTIQHYWNRNHNSRAEMTSIYDRLQSGTPFEIVARQSDDYSTANSGGLLENVEMRQLPSEYITIISKLQEGEVSHPFYTQYGWHLVKLVKREERPEFEKLEPYYRQRMVRDPRGSASRKAFASAAMKKYGVVDLTTTPVPQKGKKKAKKQPVVMQASLDSLTAHLNDKVFTGKWSEPDSVFTVNPVLARVPGKEYRLLDVVDFVRRSQKRTPRTELSFYARQRYEDFLDSITIAYADSQLEKEHPDFAELVNEYRRGLLIFNYNEKMIWTKAIKDSAGFADFYGRESAKKSLSVPGDSIYFWRTRARVVVFDVEDSRCLDSDKAVKILRKSLSKNLSMSDMQDALMKKVDKKKCEVAEPIKNSVEVVEQTRQDLLGDDQWKLGVYAVHSGKGYRLLVVQDVIAPCLKGQFEARGYYLNAWQNEVEENLNKDLRSKYRVKIHKNVVGAIKF
ncbi:MAG: peptidylprolyl isomerase [Bacteroidales bacterium]|nr:peptidylprolyl isomerase [Bacteroidales bacterium]